MIVFFAIIIYKGLGDVFYHTGNYQRAIKQYENAIWFSENKIMFRSWLILCKIALARVKVINNDPDIDMQALYDYVDDCRIKILEGRMKKYIAEILLNLDGHHLETAEKWINKAIAADRENGMNFFLGRDYALLANIHNHQGDPSKAKENLNKAIAIFKECGADGWVEKYKNEMSKMPN